MENLFFYFLILGLVCGICFEICKLTKLISKNNLFIVNVVNFIYFCIVGACFCSFLIKKCNGDLKLYIIFAFVLGMVLEQISVGFFFTKFYKMVYNVIVKIISKIKTTKVGKKILR